MNQIELLCGVENVVRQPLSPYNKKVCEFLDVLSKAIRQDREAKKYPDLQTFAFWIRKANIQNKKNDFEKRNVDRRRLGRGIVFHIAPSNVPVNCLYTFVFGLLAGNSNVVRVPSKKFPQVECACRLLGQLFEEKVYEGINMRTSFIRYVKNDEITTKYSLICNSRIIWGGDETISQIRKVSLPPRSNEITFADRYSIGILSAKTVELLDEESMDKLAYAFYNDTYLMDQNACSTPHLILWKGEDGICSENMNKSQERFWKAVEKTARKYDLNASKVSEKYAMLCSEITSLQGIKNVERYGNLIYVCTLECVQEQIEQYRGRYGLFFQTYVEGWEWLEKVSNEKIQTCAFYGVDKDFIQHQIQDRGIMGIDRVVPFGKTLDIDTMWDGYDLIEQLSRIIS